MAVNVCSYFAKPKGVPINTCSRSNSWTQGLSPFILGPVDLYDGIVAQNVENAWQFAKVYAKHVDDNGDPTEAYWEWAEAGWSDTRAHRYPMGKGAKPLYSYWDGKKLGYVEARKVIYAPLYSRAVEQSDAYQNLKQMHEQDLPLWLKDFDGYDYRKLGMTLNDVLNCETRKMGHAFVLAMMLEGNRCWENTDGTSH